MYVAESNGIGATGPCFDRQIQRALAPGNFSSVPTTPLSSTSVDVSSRCTPTNTASYKGSAGEGVNTENVLNTQLAGLLCMNHLACNRYRAET